MAPLSQPGPSRCSAAADKVPGRLRPVVEHLRDRHVDLPAILIAGKITQELRNRAWRAGFVAVLEGDLPSGRYIASELAPLAVITASVAA